MLIADLSFLPQTQKHRGVGEQQELRSNNQTLQPCFVSCHRLCHKGRRRTATYRHRHFNDAPLSCSYLEYLPMERIFIKSVFLVLFSEWQRTGPGENLTSCSQ